MLTAEQDDLIRRAAELEGLDMTAWARPILLEAAKRRAASVVSGSPKRKNPRGKGT
jgi:uncharacterized protein (DUF1778 family)